MVFIAAWAALGLWLAADFQASLAQTPPATSGPVAIRFSVDSTDGSTRVILTHAREVSRSVVPAGDRLHVLYSDSVSLDPAQGDIGDGRLQRWKQEDARTVTLFLGPAFDHFESFELKNPSRLVLDLMGRPIGTPTPGAHPAPTPARPEPSAVIVIDPGHGGVEEGAIGPTGLREKEVALDLGRRLRTLLARDSRLGVVLTREDDRYVDLDERTAIANYNRADLFISIHLNASPRRDAYGAETYFLSPEATDDEARTLAALENQAYRTSQALRAATGEGQRRTLELILWDLAQNQYLAESGRLAEAVQRELDALTGTRDRGVRQAPFRVLMGATMPAILVEAGFISNPDEEARLRTVAYRERIAEALARAVREFLRHHEVLRGRADPAADGAAHR